MSGGNNSNARASIIVAEHRLGPTPAGHTYLVVDTGRGEKPIELHGFSVDADGNRNNIGLPIDPTDKLRFREYRNEDTGRFPADKKHPVFQGTSEQVEEILRVARDAGRAVDELGLDYMLAYQNSNSMTNTILQAIRSYTEYSRLTDADLAGLDEGIGNLRLSLMAPGMAANLLDGRGPDPYPSRAGIIGRTGDEIDRALDGAGPIGDVAGSVIGGAVNAVGELSGGVAAGAAQFLGGTGRAHSEFLSGDIAGRASRFVEGVGRAAATTVGSFIDKVTGRLKPVVPDLNCGRRLAAVR